MSQTTQIGQIKRIPWVDYAKMFAIFFVVVIHTHCSAGLTIVLKGFTIQTFFFLSGFLFSRENNPEFKPFAYKRFRQLIVPYIWISLLAYVVWVTVLRHLGSASMYPGPWHEPLIAMALGIPGGMAHDIPMWSLICFFVVEMIYYPLREHVIKSDLIIALIFFILGAAVSLTFGIDGLDLPIALGPASMAICLYSLGHFSRRWIQKLSTVNLWQSAIIAIVGAALLFAGTQLNGYIQFFLGYTGEPWWFLLSSFGGIAMMFGGSQFCSLLFGDKKFVRFVSRSTLIICGFHLMAMSFMKGVALFGFGIEPKMLTTGMFHGITTAVVAFILCLPVAWIIERYFRFLVSK